MIRDFIPRLLRKKIKKQLYSMKRYAMLCKKTALGQSFEVVKELPFGKIRLDVRKPLQYYLSTTHNYEPYLLSILQHHLRAGDCAIDCGAHVGYWTIVMGHLVGSRGQVYSFECEKNNFRALEKNIAFNNLQQAKPFNCAVSDGEGQAFYHGVSHNEGGGYVTEKATGTGTSVPKVSIAKMLSNDPQAPQSIKLMKMDIEGHEIFALRGMQSIFANTLLRPSAIVIEAGFTVAERSVIFDFLTTYQYHCFDILDVACRRPLDRHEATLAPKHSIPDMYFCSSITSPNT